jgi:hypothetical protein
MRIKIIKIICNILGYNLSETQVTLPMWRLTPKKIKR